jgi:hypothetical protein
MKPERSSNKKTGHMEASEFGTGVWAKSRGWSDKEVPWKKKRAQSGSD